MKRSSPGKPPAQLPSLGMHQRSSSETKTSIFHCFVVSTNMASQVTILQADAADVPVPEVLGSQELKADIEEKEPERTEVRSSKYLDTVPNLSALFRLVVKRVAWQWEKLATMLELDNDGRKIDAIRRDFWGVGVEICCMQAIHHWVRGEGKGPVSWRTLLKCLEHIECGQVAEDIASQLEGISL